MKAKSILFVLVTLGIVMISGVETAHASVTGIATLNVCSAVSGVAGVTGGCGSGSYGTVTLTQSGANVVVSVVLNSGYYFTYGVGAGKSLYFDLPSTVTISGLSTGFTEDGTHPVGGSFTTSIGSFTDAVECSSATVCPGGAEGSTLDPTSFSFTVANVTIASFGTTNGNYFASTVYSKSGDGGNSPGTGEATASSIAISPEPMSYLLFGSGLLLLGVVSRKKLGLGRG